MSKALKTLSFLLLFILLLALPSINMDSLMNGTQSGKSIFFLYGVAIISALWIIRFGLNQGLIRIKLSTIDLLLVVVVLYILLRNNREELVHSLLFIELAGLTILYFIIRQQTHQGYLLVVLALVAGGLVQAIYGNLQLWGYFPSHHGIFKMTGSFFNPGPYSGYLAAVFPASLGLYLFDPKFEKFDRLIVRTSKYLRSISFKSFCRLKKFLSFESPNNSNNRNDSNNSNPSNISNSAASNISSLSLIPSLAIAAVIAIILVLPASRSRAAWLAVLVSSFYLLSVKYQFFKTIRKYFNTRIRQIVLISFLTILLSTTILGLYYFKKGSADGRLLIWKVSAEMISDKPVFGHGFDGFKKRYMDYQAARFKQNPDSKEALVAGDSNYAFNELIQLTVEHGLAGFFLILLLFKRVFSNISNSEASNLQTAKPSNTSNSEASYPSNISNSEASNSSSGFFRLFSFFCLRPFQSNHSNHRNNRNNRNPSTISNPSNSFYRSKAPTTETIVTIETSQTLFIHISRAVILSILVFGLFSYPLQILPIKICLTVALAIAAGTTSQNVIIDIQPPFLLRRSFQLAIKTVAATVCLIVLLSATLQIKTIGTAYTNWKNAFDLYNIGIYNECLDDYEKAYPTLKTNGDFLTNYGKALSMAEKYAEAINVLQQAARYYPNTVVYTTLGDSYRKMEQTLPAEHAYLHAWQMNPSRFYPKYLLAKLYDETGQTGKAIQVANELLEKDIKVESTAIEEIKEEMKKLIDINTGETSIKTKNKPTISQTQ